MGKKKKSSSFSLRPSALLGKAKKSIQKQVRTVRKGAKILKSGATTGVKGAIKAGKIAKAAGGIAMDLTNPYKMGKVVVNAARGKGVVYPGSKYIGPGNAMNLGKGNSSADRAAFKHDEEYGELLKKKSEGGRGIKPSKLYAGYSSADKRLMKRSDVTTKHGLATYGGMALKKGLYKMGLTGKMIK
jgi:hypothetical protein